MSYLLTEESMADGSSPPVRRRQLGMELRRLREAAGKSQQDASEWLGLRRATAISKMETGKQRVSPAYLKLLCQLYEVGSPHREALERLQRESDQRGWWVTYGDTVPAWFEDYVGMETVADEVRTYESLFVPGLLQTPEYTEAISAALNPTRTHDEIQRAVQLRADRQKRLTADQPLILHAVINEAALCCEVGGSAVMSAQAKKIAEVMQLPNVTVQVLPFSVGAHRGLRGAFHALRFPEESLSSVVYLELDGAALYQEAPSAAFKRYVSTFEQLSAIALDAPRTVALLAQVCRGEHREATPIVAQE